MRDERLERDAGQQLAAGEPVREDVERLAAERADHLLDRGLVEQAGDRVLGGGRGGPGPERGQPGGGMRRGAVAWGRDQLRSQFGDQVHDEVVGQRVRLEQRQEFLLCDGIGIAPAEPGQAQLNATLQQQVDEGVPVAFPVKQSLGEGGVGERQGPARLPGDGVGDVVDAVGGVVDQRGRCGAERAPVRAGLARRGPLPAGEARHRLGRERPPVQGEGPLAAAGIVLQRDVPAGDRAGRGLLGGIGGSAG